MFVMGQRRTCYFWVRLHNIFQLSISSQYQSRGTLIKKNLLCYVTLCHYCLYIFYTMGLGHSPYGEKWPLWRRAALSERFFSSLYKFLLFYGSFLYFFPHFPKKKTSWKALKLFRLKALLRCTSSCLSMCVWTSQLKCLHRSVLVVSSLPFCVFS